MNFFIVVIDGILILQLLYNKREYMKKKSEAGVYDGSSPSRGEDTKKLK